MRIMSVNRIRYNNIWHNDNETNNDNQLILIIIYEEKEDNNENESLKINYDN